MNGMKLVTATGSTVNKLDTITGVKIKFTKGDSEIDFIVAGR